MLPAHKNPCIYYNTNQSRCNCSSKRAEQARTDDPLEKLATVPLIAASLIFRIHCQLSPRLAYKNITRRTSTSHSNRFPRLFAPLEARGIFKFYAWHICIRLLINELLAVQELLFFLDENLSGGAHSPRSGFTWKRGVRPTSGETSSGSNYNSRVHLFTAFEANRLIFFDLAHFLSK